jgi:hypothetical protein
MNDTIYQIISNTGNYYDGDLRYYYRLVFNAPNIYNPYHNFRHMINTLCSVYRGAVFHQYHLECGPRHLRALLIAGLFHDYGHSGQMGHDHEEVANSIKLLESLLLTEDQDLLPEIKELIVATEFPHIAGELSLGAKIMRDADMSQIFNQVWLQQIVFGLAQEKGVSPLSVLEGEADLMNSLKFYSRWGQETFMPQIPGKIEEIKQLISLLN